MHGTGLRDIGRTAKGEDGQGTSPLGRLRLLVALDALLVEGSVGGAAERMEIGAPAMSRLLKQIRELYDDPIFVRTARGLVPTPFAETLRLRLRAVAAETEDLLDPDPPRAAGGNMAPRAAGGEAIIAAPPLAMRPNFRLDEQPGPADFALKLARIGPDADPRRRLAKYIATAGGAGAIGNRPLTLAEAEDGFSVVLSGDADPIQIGALFVVMHYRGVTGAELAGLVRASRAHFGAPPLGADVVDLDWPAYVSPKSRAAPWFLQAARLVAQAGHKVLVHGYGEATGARLQAAARAVDIPCCPSVESARDALTEHGVAYVDLPVISPDIHRLVELYGLFEMRSPMNLMVHLLNPLGAPASLLGMASAAQRLVHLDTATLLGWPDMAVFGNKRDVAEATPFRAATIHRLAGGVRDDLFLHSLPEPRPEPRTGLSSLEYFRAVWLGGARDEQARQTIVDTAAGALMTLDPRAATSFEACRETASDLWNNRNTVAMD